MRKTLVLLFTLFSCVLFAQDFSDLSFGTDSTFEIMTWNIEEFPKNGQTTVNQVKAILEAVDVDFVCFQEIDDSTELKLIAANISGYEVYIEEGFWSGLAVMYKSATVTIEDIYTIYDAFAYWDIFPRAPLVIEMLVDGEKIVAINNHYKCCGDGNIDAGNLDDEETKRFEATNLLKQFIDGTFPDEKVILIGDLNDELTDEASKNVFQPFLNDTDNYRFADMDIAEGSSANWSYPLWPSHLDHILVTDELFDFIESDDAVVEVLRIDDYLDDGLWDYDDDISDHRPLAMKINLNEEEVISYTYDITQQVDWNIYPNPSAENVHFKIPENLKQVEIKIYATNGNLVETLSINASFNSTWNASNYAKGMYYIQLTAENQLISSKKLLLIH